MRLRNLSVADEWGYVAVVMFDEESSEWREGTLVKNVPNEFIAIACKGKMQFIGGAVGECLSSSVTMKKMSRTERIKARML